MKNRFLFLLLIIFSLFITSCGVEENNKYDEFNKKVFELDPEGFNLNSNWYDIERVQYCNLNDNKKAIIRYKFNGYIDIIKGYQNLLIEGNSNVFNYSREITILNNYFVEKKIIFNSYLNNNKYCEKKIIKTYEGRKEISNDLIVNGNNDVDKVHIEISRFGRHLKHTMYYEEYATKSYTIGNNLILNDDKVIINFNHDIYLHQEAYFDKEKLNIYKFVENFKTEVPSISSYESIVKVVYPNNNIVVPEFDTTIKKKDIRLDLDVYGYSEDMF